jgi:hypothetical protein
MTHCSIATATIDGFDAVEVNAGPIALILIPELGGKISSLRDLRSGREWLWRHPRMAYRRVSHGSSYITEADTGGWDECFPTVAPCPYPAPPWAGAALQDHGELWSQAAQLDVMESAGSVALRTRWRGVALPYTFERTITLTAGAARLHFEYAASSHADAPIRFIWSAHPLLAIEPGMQLLLPPSARFNRWAAIPTNLLAQDSGLTYPPIISAHARTIDLASLPDASAGVALKLWSDPLDQGWAALRAGWRDRNALGCGPAAAGGLLDEPGRVGRRRRRAVFQSRLGTVHRRAGLAGRSGRHAQSVRDTASI